MDKGWCLTGLVLNPGNHSTNRCFRFISAIRDLCLPCNPQCKLHQKNLMNMLNFGETHSLFQVEDLRSVPKIYSKKISDIFLFCTFLTDHLLWQCRVSLPLHREIFDNVPENTNILSINVKRFYFDNVTSIDEFRIIPIPSILIEKIAHFNHHSIEEHVIRRERKSW